jgi:hypothetical protein
VVVPGCVCTNVCMDKSHGDVHTGIRVWHMMPHAQLAGSVATFACLSGDLHACLRKTRKGLGVHCMQLADTGSAMQMVRSLFRSHALIAGGSLCDTA